MTPTCPTCGKPVRLGAKFCGNCGAVLAVKPPVSASEAGSACPYCGKPIRPEARFCASCGRNLPAVAQPAENQPIIAAAPPVSAQARPNRSVIGGVIFAIVLLCILVGLGALLFQKPIQALLGLNRKATSTPILTQSTTNPIQTNIPVLPATSTVSPVTLTPLPTITRSPEPLTPLLTEPSGVLTTTIAPLLTENPNLSLPGEIVLQDNFSGFSQQLWDFIGLIKPESINLADVPLLRLDSPGHGVSNIVSKTLIKLIPGLIIQFKAQIDQTAPTENLFMDWYPGESFNPEPTTAATKDSGKQAGTTNIDLSPGVGIIQLRIGNRKAAFQVWTPENSCEKQLLDSKLHTYEIQVKPGLSFNVLLDHAQFCHLSGDNLPSLSDGRLVFSGQGYLNQLMVSINP